MIYYDSRSDIMPDRITSPSTDSEFFYGFARGPDERAETGSVHLGM
jgi:hypothetical protein